MLVLYKGYYFTKTIKIFVQCFHNIFGICFNLTKQNRKSICKLISVDIVYGKSVIKEIEYDENSTIVLPCSNTKE